jgi:hypothetical protein
MSKVFPVQDMFVGAPNGGIRLRREKAWDSNDPFVKAHPDLFDEPEEDPRDAEIAELKAKLAELQTRRKATS